MKARGITLAGVGAAPLLLAAFALLAGCALLPGKGPQSSRPKVAPSALIEPVWLSDIAFIDSSRGWAVGRFPNDDVALVRTIDGGRQWSVETTRGWQGLNAIHFRDDGEGWIACEAYGRPGTGAPLLHTTDGGESWRAVDAESLGRGNFGGVFAIAPGSAVVLRSWRRSQPAAVLLTVDGGRSWRGQRLGSGEVRLKAVAFSDPRRGWIVGNREEAGTPVGLAFRTSDGGRTWRRVQLPASDQLSGVAAPNGRVAFIASESPQGLLVTRDAGQSWERRLDRLLPEGLPLTLVDVAFTNPQDGWAVGAAFDERAYEATPLPVALRTSDGGTTWVRKTIPRGDSWFVLPVAVASPDGRIAYIAGGGGIAIAGP